MAITRSGLGGPQAEYLGFSAKDPAVTPQAAYVVDFLIARVDDIYFIAQ